MSGKPLPSASPPALQVQELHYAWPGNADFRLALPALSLPAGGSLFIHGPSGSGKSTLLNLLGGVLQPQRGRIALLGQPFSDWPAPRRDAFRAEHLGFIFQQFNLIPYLPVLDNVLLPCRLSPRRAARCPDAEASARELLHRLGLPPSLYRRPAHTLSVGQQQRVAAARALLGRPALLIADEPTSALDRGNQASFVELLREEAAAGGSALVFVSHDPGLACHFRQQLVLQADGKPDEQATASGALATEAPA